jgi:hypothetical protein
VKAVSRAVAGNNYAAKRAFEAATIEIKKGCLLCGPTDVFFLLHLWARFFLGKPPNAIVVPA